MANKKMAEGVVGEEISLINWYQDEWMLLHFYPTNLYFEGMNNESPGDRTVMYHPTVPNA